MKSTIEQQVMVADKLLEAAKLAKDHGDIGDYEALIDFVTAWVSAIEGWTYCARCASIARQGIDNDQCDDCDLECERDAIELEQSDAADYQAAKGCGNGRG